MNQRALGKQYEEKAAEYLKEKGFRLLSKNFQCRQGEIDLIGIQENCLVFTEVKYRSGEKSGTPEEAVGALKQQRICRASDYFRAQNPRYAQMQVRYDVIAITGENIRWYKDAFPYCTKKTGISW